MAAATTGTDKIKAHLTLTLPSQNSGCIWVHACSVGEVGSIVPLANRLVEHGYHVHLTVITQTGFDHAIRLLGQRITVSFLPWDLPGLMARFVRQLQPQCLLLAETEFWPGMLKACHRQGVKIIGINTRISDRSFPRYRASRSLWRRWLAPVDLFLAQSDIDAQRLAEIGVSRERVRTTGNLKYAMPAPNVDANALRCHVDPTGQRPILLIASTHENEESRLLHMLPTWKAACPELLPVIVPRHPERFEDVARLIRDSGLKLRRWNEGPDTVTDIVLVDAMGILSSLYAIADVVVIGGSLADIGGHNPLEAAVCGRGVVTGPHIQNFRTVMSDLQRCGGAIVACDDAELQEAILQLLKQPEQLARLHAEAARFMHQQEDVLMRVWQLLEPELST